MKFTIASKSLLSHLSAVSKVVSQKNTIAILDNFLFTIKDNMLIATGTRKIPLRQEWNCWNAMEKDR